MLFRSRDTSVRKERKEHFYHGILLGLFGNMDHWNVMSNAEAGEGYCDIAVEIDNLETGIMIELKYAEDAAFEEMFLVLAVMEYGIFLLKFGNHKIGYKYR